MKREEALELLHKHMENENLRRHCYAVEATMRALARRLDGNEDTWGIAGLLHDADYEKTKDNDPHVNHTKLALEWLEKADARLDVRDAVAAHGWNYVEGAPEENGIDPEELGGFHEGSEEGFKRGFHHMY